MALLRHTWLYITLPWFYFTLLDSTLLYQGYTSLYFTLHYSTLAILKSTWVYITLPWFYFTLLDSTFPVPSFNFTLLDSTLLYQGSTSLYVILHYSTVVHLHSTGLYITLPWLYFTLLDSTLLYHGWISLYFTLSYSTMALLHSRWFYTLLNRGSTSLTWLNVPLPWL